MYNKPFETLILETMENPKEYGYGFNSHTLYSFLGYDFLVLRNEKVDYYGKPVYTIVPQGFINELPKLQGYRRNNVRKWYTTSSSSIEDAMIDFFTKLYEIIGTPNDTLYYNVKAVK